jgi:hypothetical protein
MPLKKLFPTRDPWEHIRPEYRVLIERGDVTYEEFKDLRCNSWEFDAFYKVLTDDAFLTVLENTILPNSSIHRCKTPAGTYDESLISVFTPELIRRFKLAKNQES